MKVGYVYFWENRYKRKEPYIEMTMDGDVAEMILNHLKGDIAEAAEAGLLDDCIALAKACSLISDTLERMAKYDAEILADETGGYAE